MTQNRTQTSAATTPPRSSGSGVGGRKRFYAHADVAPCRPVWEAATADAEDSSSSSSNLMMDSPISMGVDGTDSASGVERPISNDDYNNNQSQLRFLLEPRSPFLKDDDDENDDKSSSSNSETTNNQKKEWYSVRLDGRTLRTPAGQPLALPSQALAYAIAAEWNAVDSSSSIRPAQMPLMTLAATALDQTIAARDNYMAQTLNFLTTDTVCFYADPAQDRILQQRQEAAWSALHGWIVDTFGQEPAVVTGHVEGLWLAKSNRQLPHPPALVQACQQVVQSLDAWHLTALYSMASEAKSFWIALALLWNHSNSNPWTVEAAMAAARVEEEFNIANWGLVEGGHDYDRLNCSVQLHAAVVLKDCLALDGY